MNDHMSGSIAIQTWTLVVLKLEQLEQLNLLGRRADDT